MLRLVAAQWRSKDAYVSFGNFRSLSFSSIQKALHKHLKCAEVSKHDSRLIAFECPSITQELEFNKLAADIRDALSVGVSCALVLRPESSGLLHYLPDALILGTSALRLSQKDIQTLLPKGSVYSAQEILTATGGIATLVSSFINSNQVTKNQSKSIPLSELLSTPTLDFSISIQSLMCESLRPSLPEDELRLRLAMLLLGYGSIDKAIEVVGGLRNGFTQIHVDEAPLFNATFDFNTFECVYPNTPESFNACVPVLQEAAQSRFSVVSHAVKQLVKEHRYARAALIARKLGGDAVMRSLVLSAPFELLGVGETNLIRQVLAMSDAPSNHSSTIGRYAAEAALAWADNDWGRLSKINRALPAIQECEAKRLIRQIRAATATLQVTRTLDENVLLYLDELAEVAKSENEYDPVSNLLGAHALIVRNLFQGRPEAAFQIALSAAAEAQSDEKHAVGMPLYQTLIESDLLAVQILVGEDQTLRFSPSFKLLHASDGAPVQNVLRVHTLMRQVLALTQGESKDTKEVERYISAAERHGQTILAASLMLSRAMGDLFGGAKIRAFVRCQKATELAHEGKATFLWRQIALMAAVIDTSMGNETNETIADLTGAMSWRDKEIGPVEWVLSALARGDVEVLAHSASQLRSVRLPLEWRFQLMSLTRLGGTISETLIHALPTRWRPVLQAKVTTDEAQSDDLAEKKPTRKQNRKSVPKQQDKCTSTVKEETLPPLRINLLGNLEILRGDMPIPESAWTRKRARLLLAMLAVAEGHTLTRAEAVSALWPDCDYLVGRDRLYVTLGSLRKALGQSSAPGGYVDGSDGRLWLNMTYVTCDVDDFERACDQALSRVGNDAITIQRCLNARELYIGDLAVVSDATGFMQAKREEERRRFVDVMVEGAEASLRQGSPTRAEWFARTACHADSLREDVAEAELKALFAQGRTVEAHREYERYAQGLIETTGLPPSSSMRRLMTEVEAKAGREKKITA